MSRADAVDLGFARVDVGREARQGLPEAIYGTGKTAGEIASIAWTLLRHNDGPVLATRVDAGVAESVLAAVREGAPAAAAALAASTRPDVGVADPARPSAGVAASTRLDVGVADPARPSAGVAASTRPDVGVADPALVAVQHTAATPAASTGLGADAASASIPHGTYDAAARLLVWRPASPTGFTVVVAAAGTADQPVAREAAAIAAAVGLDVTTVTDVGVAGLHRLLAEQDRLRAADTVIVVAGMEGALASAIGGLVACPVVAVPTSTGYGAGLEGITALLAMHASCAAGITVVNIDSGFGAAMAAFRLSRVAVRSKP
jgi:hypothetical protein